MTREKKEKILGGLVPKLASASCFYVVDAEGLDTEKVNDFRERCFRADVAYQVVKNTLVRKAFEKLGDGLDYTSFGNVVLKGFSGILFPKRDAESAPARIIQDFRKQKKINSPLFKGALVAKEMFVGEEHLEILSRLKSKNELIGELVELLKSPFKRIVSSLQSGRLQIAGIVKALAEKRP